MVAQGHASQMGRFLLLRGYLGMSEDIFDCHDRGVYNE